MCQYEKEIAMKATVKGHRQEAKTIQSELAKSPTVP
jgi:hypothetical protein